MKTNIFLAALPSYDNRLVLTQKIHSCEAKRSPLIKIQWAHTNDLHVTLGFIGPVNENDLRFITMAMTSITQNTPFMANVEEIRLFGNAIVLRIEPYHRFLAIHKSINQKLIEVTQSKYKFDDKKRYDSHLTIGRIRNINALNPMHKHQLISLIAEQFRNATFLIQQAALLQRISDVASPAYQSLQLYTFNG